MARGSKALVLHSIVIGTFLLSVLPGSAQPVSSSTLQSPSGSYLASNAGNGEEGSGKLDIVSKQGGIEDEILAGTRIQYPPNRLQPSTLRVDYGSDALRFPDYINSCDGDLNRDGNVTPSDALIAIQCYLGLISPLECECADVDNDGQVTPADALCIFRSYLSFPSCLDCRLPLDDETLDRVVVTSSRDTDFGIQPGESCAFQIGTFECCYFFDPITPTYRGCPTWSITPTEGATIDQDTGILTIDASTPSGSIYTVSANIQGTHSSRQVSSTVYVVTPESNPLVGTWHESKQLICDTEEQIVPSEPIREICFLANGKFTVTWHPFEVYIDYEGWYIYNLESGELMLTVTRGNYIPRYINGYGSFSFTDDGQLVLKDIWLGSPSGSNFPIVLCGHILSP